MAYNPPLPGMPLAGLNQAIATGGNLFQQMMQPVLEREKQKQLERHFQEQLKLSKAAAARAAQAAADEHKKMDPLYEYNRYKALQDMVQGNGNPNAMPQQQMPTEEVGQGMGVFSPEGLQSAQTNPPQISPNAPNQGGINFELMKQNPILRGFFKQKFGYDPLVETPEQKREAEFADKVKLEEYKAANKEKAIEQKEISAVKKDLRTLRKSLKGVDELLRIAKQNPEMFGHGFMPDRYAKTTKIKDFGKWQNLISDAIAGLEQKLSAKGNVVALKLASQLKPSHAEQQDVAIGKLESMRQQLVDSINHSLEVTGQKPIKENQQTSGSYNDTDLVIVEGPNGEETMTYAQAKSLGAV